MVQLGEQFKYVPDPYGPEEGSLVPHGEGWRWHQRHDALVRDAVHQWTGAPSTMHIHMSDEEAGAPIPPSGSGAHLRAQGAALLHELTHRSVPSPRPLYRGVRQNMGNVHLERSRAAEEAPGGTRSWTTRRSVAQRFAGKRGYIRELPKGTPGLRVTDYTSGGIGSEESEWIVRH